MHPVKTLKNICNVIVHPVQSAKALFTWAKQNPWKCGAIVVGGLILGAVGLGGVAFLIDAYIFDFTVTVLPWLVVHVVRSSIVFFFHCEFFAFFLKNFFFLNFRWNCCSISVTSDRANVLIKEAKNEESKLQHQFNRFASNLNAVLWPMRWIRRTMSGGRLWMVRKPKWKDKLPINEINKSKRWMRSNFDGVKENWLNVCRPFEDMQAKMSDRQ